ncbi:MAG: hypothetical protein KC588_10830 [Nitrospira sp.]|nr:hypothetical protein [Nitrospira sp.]
MSKVWLLTASCLLLLASLGGCAGGIDVHSHFLTTQRFPAHPPGFVLDEWETPPTQSFIRLAEINGKGPPEEDDEILAQVLNEARKLGADGVLIERADLLQTFDRPRNLPFESRLVDSAMTSTGGSYDLSMSTGAGNFGQNTPEDFNEIFFITATAIKYFENKSP